MNIKFTILLMVFCHILDDYTLQGWLANGKQRSWWESNAPQKLYKYDYIIALLMHSMSWSFMIMLPIAIYSNFIISDYFIAIFVFNTCVHMIVDNMKANQKIINLWIDQLIHLAQIALTAFLLLY